MGKALIVIIAVALAVYAFFDLLATDRRAVRYLNKWIWLLLVVALPYVGPLAWVTLGTTRLHPPQGARGPDDDPDYLRHL